MDSQFNPKIVEFKSRAFNNAFNKVFNAYHRINDDVLYCLLEKLPAEVTDDITSVKETVDSLVRIDNILKDISKRYDKSEHEEAFHNGAEYRVARSYVQPIEDRLVDIYLSTTDKKVHNIIDIKIIAPKARGIVNLCYNQSRRLYNVLNYLKCIQHKPARDFSSNWREALEDSVLIYDKNKMKLTRTGLAIIKHLEHRVGDYMPPVEAQKKTYAPLQLVR